MILVISVFFGLYIVLLGSIVGLGYVLQRRKENRFFRQKEKIELRELVVLIPFRNEEARIDGLLHSIQKSLKHPKEYIFINDHSTDRAVDKIEEALLGIRYRVLHSPTGVQGKKKALRFGTAQSNSRYILTLDADVEFVPAFFYHISRLGEADMYVNPAIMKAKHIGQYLYEIDLELVTGANSGLAGLKRPIMASGANLLYKREAFEQLDDLESHIHAASGDDTYLLRDFREGRADVRLMTDPAVAIYTETPQSLKEFFDQRLRWIGKTTDIKDNLSTALAILQATLTIAFFALLIWFALSSERDLFAAVFSLKVLIDMLIYAPYLNRIERQVSWLLIPIYELVFPLYTFVLIILLLTYKPKWKGRGIYTSKIGFKDELGHE